MNLGTSFHESSPGSLLRGTPPPPEVAKTMAREAANQVAVKGSGGGGGV